MGFLFFFCGEFAERFSFYGMVSILALYMTDEWGWSKGDASRYQSIFKGAVYLTPLLGGLIADRLLGKYWTIVGFSVPYVVAHVIVGEHNSYVFIGALALLAMGSGVIKPNISSLMGMTYDQQRPGRDSLRTAAFSWFYFAINFGAFLSQIIVPYIRTEFDYQKAFLTPAAFMVVALLVFAAGKKYYAVESVGKRVQRGPAEEPSDTADNWKIVGLVALLFAPCCFFWAIFDQNSITWVYFTDTYTDTDLNLPYLGKVTFSSDGLQWFNSLFILIFVPISIGFWKYLDRKGIEIRATAKLMAGFFLTAVCTLILAGAGLQAGHMTETLKISTPVADIAVPVQAFEIDGQPAPMKEGKVKFSDERKFGSATIREGSLLLTIDGGEIKKGKLSFKNGLLTIPAGTVKFVDGHIDVEQSTAVVLGKEWKIPGATFVEWKETVLQPGEKNAFQVRDGVVVKSTAKKPDNALAVSNFEYVPQEEKVTVWWQIAAYLIITFAEILVSITGLELAFVVAPQSMKSFVTALWLVTVGVANLLINAPITGLYPKMQPGNYFLLLTAMMVAVMAAFFFIARYFNRELAKRHAPPPDPTHQDGEIKI